MYTTFLLLPTNKKKLTIRIFNKIFKLTINFQLQICSSEAILFGFWREKEMLYASSFFRYALFLYEHSENVQKLKFYLSISQTTS